MGRERDTADDAGDRWAPGASALSDRPAGQDWFAHNWEYVAGGAMVMAGGVLIATGVGGPVGVMLISAGADTIIQEATTGHVDWGEVALTGALGAYGGAGAAAKLGLTGAKAAFASGVIAGGTSGGTTGAYTYTRSPGPHTVQGFLGATTQGALFGGATGGAGVAAGHLLKPITGKLLNRTGAELGQQSGAALHGSGPVPGVLEASPRVKSVSALKNYSPRGMIEYVFDSSTGTMVTGRPAARLGLRGSPREQLAASIGTSGEGVVGGMLRRSAGGTFVTDEISGHYGKNWTPEIRAQFEETMTRYGLDVVHG